MREKRPNPFRGAGESGKTPARANPFAAAPHHRHDESGCPCCGGVTSLALSPEEESGKIHWAANLPWLIAMAMVLAMNALTELAGAEIPANWQFCYYLAAYVLAAGSLIKVVLHRLRYRHEFFNEFTLMLLATLGAFYHGDFSEGVSVMIFYRIGETFQARAVSRAKRSIRELLSGRTAPARPGDSPADLPAHLVELIEQAARRKSRVQEFITRFARVYTPSVVGIAVLVVFLPYLWSEHYVFNDHFYNALGFLIIACPCALVVSIPLGYFGGLGLAGKHGILFKGAGYLDAAAKVDTVIFDKTGTLTSEHPEGAEELLKERAPHAVAMLKARRIRTVLLSCDSPEKVEKVGKQCGFDESVGGLTMQDKVNFLKCLQAEHHTVAFVGDGVNDAPAIALADIGFAMGGLGSDAAVKIADAVVRDDDPAKVPMALEAGRRTRAVVWQNIMLAFAVKLLVMVLLALGMSELWEAVFADVGVTLLAIMNAIRLQKQKLA